jgi:hypothetical protein
MVPEIEGVIQLVMWVLLKCWFKEIFVITS